jgi:hypothetical protein
MPSSVEGHPMLAMLLKDVERLRNDLPGWVPGHLVPVLAGFQDDATEAQIDTSLAKLRKVLRERAPIDPWLGEIAELGIGEYARTPRAMNWPSDQAARIELPQERIRNRTVVEQARQLTRELTASPKQEKSSQKRPGSKPDGE